MADEEALARIYRSLDSIDAHVERGNVLMESNEAASARHEAAAARHEAAAARHEAAFDRNTAEFEKNREFYAKTTDDWREFTRSILVRVERVGRDEIRALSRMNDELSRTNDALARQGAELSRQGAEQHDQSRAQTEALLRVIDRLDLLDGGPPPPT